MAGKHGSAVPDEFDAHLGVISGIIARAGAPVADPLEWPALWGLTAGQIARWHGRTEPVAVPDEDISGICLPAAEMSALLRVAYWCPIMGDRLPAGVDLCLLDCAVALSVEAAVGLLQHALGQEACGLMNRRTLQAVEREEAAFLVRDISRARLAESRRHAHLPGDSPQAPARIAAIEDHALMLATGIAHRAAGLTRGASIQQHPAANFGLTLAPDAVPARSVR